jgi:hypothetical protein
LDYDTTTEKQDTNETADEQIDDTVSNKSLEKPMDKEVLDNESEQNESSSNATEEDKQENTPEFTILAALAALLAVAVRRIG